jgi:hypothetical protein
MGLTAHLLLKKRTGVRNISLQSPLTKPSSLQSPPPNSLSLQPLQTLRSLIRPD